MPRIRTIKPEFFKHFDLFSAEKESKMPLRLAFSGLWLCCDKEGRFKWRPHQLKLDILPYDEVDFNEVLSALAYYDFIKKYEYENQWYGFIPTFKEHQRITGSEASAESKLPDPKNGIIMETPKKQQVINMTSDFNPPVNVKKKTTDSYSIITTLETTGNHTGNDLDDWKGKERKGKEEGKETESGDFFYGKDSLVDKMVKIFIEIFPEYPPRKNEDAAACLQIAYEIAVKNKWDNNSVYNGKMDETIKFWRQIVQFGKTDSWFSTRSLSDYNKEWQRLIQKYNSLHGQTIERNKNNSGRIIEAIPAGGFSEGRKRGTN